MLFNPTWFIAAVSIYKVCSDKSFPANEVRIQVSHLAYHGDFSLTVLSDNPQPKIIRREREIRCRNNTVGSSNSDIILGWPKSLFGFFRNTLWKSLNELFGQPNRYYIYYFIKYTIFSLLEPCVSPSDTQKNLMFLLSSEAYSLPVGVFTVQLHKSTRLLERLKWLFEKTTIKNQVNTRKSNSYRKL